MRAAIDAALAEKAALQMRIDSARAILNSQPEYTLSGLAELRGSISLHAAILGWEVAGITDSHLTIFYKRRNAELYI